MYGICRWKIPAFSNKDAKSLCYGYIRDNYTKSRIPKVMPVTCMNYFYDRNIIKKIKNLSQCQVISNIYEIGPYKFQMRLLLNLFNEASITLNITLASGPITTKPKIHSFKPLFTIKICETNTIAKNINLSGLSEEDKKCQFWYDFGPIKNIKSKLKNKMTIELQVIAFNALNNKGNIIPIKSINYSKSSTQLNEITIPSSSYYWNLCQDFNIKQFKNAFNGQYFCSSIFEMVSFNWMIKIFPNGDFSEDKGNVDLYLLLTSLPPHIDTLYIGYKFIINDTNKTFTCDGFHAFNHHEMCIWISNLKTKQIQQLD
eukprot:226781_1